jgi:hypothetical protein
MDRQSAPRLRSVPEALVRSAFAFVGVLISGCAAFGSLPSETRGEEIAWQSLHGIDAVQTLAIARDPDCFQEESLDPLIGKHPSEGIVVLWAAAASVLHFLVTDWLADHDNPALVRVWEGITIATTGYVVVRNIQIGVRPFAHDEPKEGACAEPKESSALALTALTSAPHLRRSLDTEEAPGLAVARLSVSFLYRPPGAPRGH